MPWVLFGRHLCQYKPDDKSECGDAVDGNGQVGEGDCYRGQGTERGDDDRNDNCHMESRFCFNFE